MAADIGPRIGIDGEAEFRKALSSINQQVKTFGAELKAAATSADAEGDAVKNAAKQHEILEKQVEAQRKKYQTLYVQMLKVTQAYGENSDKALKMRQDVARAETELNKLESQLKQTDTALDKAGKAAKEMGDDMEKAGKKSSGFGDMLKANLSSDSIMGAASAVAGTIKDIASFVMDYSSNVETATSKVNAYFGDTGSAAEQNAEIIRDVYTNGVGGSLEDVADKLILVKQNLDGLDSNQIEEITQEITVLEQSFGIDASESLRGVNALMEQFGLTAEEAMDYLVAGTQNGLDKTNELGDNLSEYAGKFAQAGYSAEEYFQLLQNGLDNGAYNLDKVNDAINEVTTRLSDGTISKKLKLYSEDTQNLFTAWQEGGATQKEVIDSIIQDIQNASTQQEALNLAAQAFGTMAEDGNLKFVESLTTVGTAYDDVAGKAQMMVEQTETTQSLLSSAFRTVQDALLPIGDIINNLASSVIPMLAGAFADLINGVNFDSINTQISSAVGWFNSLVTAVSNGEMTIGEALGQVSGKFTETIGNILSQLGEALPGILQAGVDIVLNLLQGIVDNTPQLLQGVTDLITGAITAIGENLPEFLTKGMEIVASLVNGVIDSLPDMIASAVEAVAAFLQSVTDNLPEIVAKGVEMLLSIVSGIIDSLPDIVSAAGRIVSSVIDTIKSTNWISVGIDILSGIGQGIINGIGSVVSAARNAASSILNSIKGFFGIHSPSTVMRDMIGGNMMQGWANGIRGGIHGTVGAMQSASRQVYGAIGGQLPAYATASAPGAGGFGGLQIVLSDGTLVGKLSPAINRTLGGYTKMQGRYKVSV